MTKPFKLVLSLVLPQLAGLIGTLFTSPSIGTWYASLERPALNPPNWVFAPVWTTLFVLMGIALYLIWAKEPHLWQPTEKKLRRTALGVFGIQLFLNTTWSLVFFGLHSPGAALVIIVFLWLAILANVILFYRLNPISGLLLIPYLLWVSFATYLNAAFWLLN